MQPIRAANGNLPPSRFLRGVLVCAVFCGALPAACAQDGNGIHVGEPRVYDSRELTLMLDSLSQQLQNKNFIDPKALAAALGNVQGFQSTDSSNAFFANGAVGPQAALVFGSGAATAASSAAATAASTGTTSTAPSVTINIAAPAAATPTATATTTAAGIGPQAPALPALQTPPAFNPAFGPSASDLLADETNLTYQIYNLNLLIDRSLTDRIDLQPVPAIRKSTGNHVSRRLSASTSTSNRMTKHATPPQLSRSQFPPKLGNIRPLSPLCRSRNPTTPPS
jgi:hypothetical protein